MFWQRVYIVAGMADLDTLSLTETVRRMQRALRALRAGKTSVPDYHLNHC